MKKIPSWPFFLGAFFLWVLITVFFVSNEMITILDPSSFKLYAIISGIALLIMILSPVVEVLRNTVKNPYLKKMEKDSWFNTDFFAHSTDCSSNASLCTICRASRCFLTLRAWALRVYSNFFNSPRPNCWDLFTQFKNFSRGNNTGSKFRRR